MRGICCVSDLGIYVYTFDIDPMDKCTYIYYMYIYIYIICIYIDCMCIGSMEIQGNSRT